MAEYSLTNSYGSAITVAAGATIQNWGTQEVRVTADTSPTNDANAIRIPPGKAYRNTGTASLTVRARSMSSSGLLGIVTGL